MNYDVRDLVSLQADIFAAFVPRDLWLKRKSATEGRPNAQAALGVGPAFQLKPHCGAMGGTEPLYETRERPFSLRSPRRLGMMVEVNMCRVHHMFGFLFRK